MDDDRSDVAFLKEMHKISRPEAVDRKQKLEKFMSNFDERRTPSKEMIEELKKWKATVSSKMNQVNGRVLPPEDISFLSSNMTNIKDGDKFSFCNYLLF